MNLTVSLSAQFLSHHGGSANAFTSAEYTTYFFDVAEEHLCGALDRLGSFPDLTFPDLSETSFPGLHLTSFLDLNPTSFPDLSQKHSQN